MEKTLIQLFDYQKFAANAALQGVIDAVHARPGKRVLSLEDADLVSAAGDPHYKSPTHDDRKDSDQTV